MKSDKKSKSDNTDTANYSEDRDFAAEALEIYKRLSPDLKCAAMRKMTQMLNETANKEKRLVE